MGSVFYRVFDWVKWCFGVVPKSAVGSPVIYLTVHYVLLLIVAGLLAYFSSDIRVALNLSPRMENMPRWLDQIWCGAVFLLVYAIIRVVIYLLELMGIEDESEFPDIDADWKDILEALDRERLLLDDLPVFLINGLTPQQEQSAIATAPNIDWKVIAPPTTRESACVRVFANDRALFLSCTGVGATNCQHGKVLEKSGSNLEDLTATSEELMRATTGTQMGRSPPEPSGFGTHMTGPPAAMPAIGSVSSAPPPTAGGALGNFFQTMAPGSMMQAMRTFSKVNSVAKGFGKVRLAPITKIESLVGTRRMQYLCDLINERRRPYCPLNGMLQAIPLSWASSRDYAKSLAPSIRDDIAAVHEALHLQFPVVAVVTELDDVSGVREFLLRTERLRPGLRLSRAGASFAPGAEINEENVTWVVDRSIQWFKGWIYTAYSHSIDHRDNQHLFRLLCEVEQRRESLVTLIRESLYRVTDPELRLYGCYFAATGRKSTEQGFERGILDKLIEFENDVAWSPHLVRKQRNSAVISWLLWLGAVVMTAISVWIFVTQLRSGAQ